VFGEKEEDEEEEEEEDASDFLSSHYQISFQIDPSHSSKVFEALARNFVFICPFHFFSPSPINDCYRFDLASIGRNLFFFFSSEHGISSADSKQTSTFTFIPSIVIDN